MTNPPHAAPGKQLSNTARRALEEASERETARKKSGNDVHDAGTKPKPNETAGPKGVEPTRYGDWERGGITYDF